MIDVQIGRPVAPTSSPVPIANWPSDLRGPFSFQRCARVSMQEARPRSSERAPEASDNERTRPPAQPSARGVPSRTVSTDGDGLQLLPKSATASAGCHRQEFTVNG